MLPGGQSVAASAVGAGDAGGLGRADGDAGAVADGVALGAAGAAARGGGASAEPPPAASVVDTSAEAGWTSGPPPRKASTTTSRRITLSTARTDMRRRQ